ncbi:MAG TPA: AI-2E family transporter [Thermoleophilaceae bacterium]|nr:AI-2E family transporter [Thermoleophilaceae bacterium]
MSAPTPPSPAADLVPGGLRRASAYAWRVLLLVGAAAIVLWLIARLRVVVLPVLAALLLAALVEPVARRLRRTRLPDWIVAAVTLIGLIALLVGISLLVVPGVVGQIKTVNLNVTQGLREIERFVLSVFPVSEAQLERTLRGAFRAVQSGVADLAGQAVGAAGVALEVVVGALVTLFLLFFFVKDGPRFYRWLRAVVPESRRRNVEELVPEIWETLQSYLVGVVIIGLFDAVFIGLALLVIGVPLVLPLAVLTFFAAFFPLVGAFVAGAVAALVALVSGGIGDALLVVAAGLVVQQVEGNLLQPVVMGRQVQLHPAVTLLSVAAGGTVAGIAGAFLAVPVAAVTRRVLRYASPRLANAGERAREEAKVRRSELEQESQEGAGEPTPVEP